MICLLHLSSYTIAERWKGAVFQMGWSMTEIAFIGKVQKVCRLVEDSVRVCVCVCVCVCG
jgi:hypothetical protein